MPDNAQQDDDLVINLVELTLSQPEADRGSYLRSACGASQELFEQVWHYVQWEQRMGRFLLDPLFPPLEERHFDSGELLENRFRILKEVAQGGMGVVYEALDEKLGRRIAIKCAKSGFSKRLPPEVRHASEISHPNVCKIFEIHTAATDYGEIDFITMEFLEGETLADLLRRGRLPREKALLIARQVSAGLAEAHRNRVVHGDLKSNNVIVTAGPDGATRAVVTDFGLARRPETSQSTLLSENEQGGTPDYMAPELWKGAKASASSDVYALGVLLYELVSGQRPYPPELSWEQRQRFKPPLVDAKWDKLLARCLDPDPAHRFSDAKEVAQAIEPPSSRRRWFLAVAAAAVLAVGTGVVTYLRTATPRESVRLAVLPFESTPETAPLADKLIPDAAGLIAHLEAGPKIKLSVMGPQEAVRKKIDSPEKARSILGATHALHGMFEKQNDKTVLHAYVTDLKSGVSAKEWTAEYASGETRYIPTALAGVVTETFHMPALMDAAAVNAAAAQDYWTGLYYSRRNSTVEKAVHLLERAIAADPDSPLTYAALAEAEYWKFTITGEALWLNRSAESVRKAQLRNPDLAQVHRVAGLHKRRAGWYDQAAAEYRRAIELDPSNGDAYRRLGIVQQANTQMDEALASYLRAIEVAPQDYRNYNSLGAFYDGQADYEKAAGYYRRAVELASEEPSEHFALGNVYLKLGDIKRAERELRLGIHSEPTATALNDLGVVLIYEGNNSEAIQYISQALALHPQTNAYLFWMNLGIAYRLNHNRAESKRANQRGLESAQEESAKNVRDGYVHSCLAYLCARLEKRDRAGYEIDQALKQSPNNTEVRFIAVETYEALNQRKDSLDVLRASPPQVLRDVSRFPDLADLQKDSRFQQLLASHPLK